MSTKDKIKSWLQEQAPMLTVLYENKYIGMAQDRFASLPPQTQKKALLGLVLSVFGLVGLFLVFNYVQLWKLNSRNKEALALGVVIQQYQKTSRDKADELSEIERSAGLSAPGQLKQKLLDVGRLAGISPKLIQAEERGEGSFPATPGKPNTEQKFKKATVSLEKMTLPQILNYIKNVESGPESITISSLKIRSDEKLRGYMGVDIEVQMQIVNREVP